MGWFPQTSEQTEAGGQTQMQQALDIAAAMARVTCTHCTVSGAALLLSHATTVVTATAMICDAGSHLS
jgi:hypothetical protein